MTAPHKLKTIIGVRHSHRRGFTLVELMASMTIMVILMGATTSTILIASHAIPDSEDPAQKKLAATDVVDQMAGELFYATSITEATRRAVTFTVADRGHGAAGPETIRYAWSGTPGDPLTRQYNDGTVVNVSEGVERFKLVYTTRTTPLQGTPRVLLVVGDGTSPNAQDLAKQALIESFGFLVQMVGDNRSEAEFSPLIADHDVMYISNQISTADLLDKSLDLAMGIITEKRSLYPDLGIAANLGWANGDNVWIADNTHEITSPFAVGSLTICDSAQKLAFATGQLAPGLQVLGQQPGPGPPAMAVLDAGAEQYGGGTARGRRVMLPWGRTMGFDINSLNKNGETIMRRSIVWAAAPVVYSGVRIVLQPATDPERLRTEVQVFNMPKANAP